MKNKGKFFGILLPILFVLIVVVIVLVGGGVLDEVGVTAGEVIPVELEEIKHIRISQEQHYLEDYDDALWTDVWMEHEPETVKELYEAIGAVAVKKGDGIDDSLAGGSSRYVIFFLKDGTRLEVKFVDDMQFWLNGTCWHFKKNFVLYEKLDEILEGHQYTKEPGA